MKAVSDVHGQKEHTIISIAEAIGKNAIRRSIFDLIYGRNRKPLTKKQMMEKLSITDNKSQQVTNALSHLSKKKVIKSEGKVNKKYERLENVDALKAEIRKSIDNKKYSDSLVARRYPKPSVTIKNESTVIKHSGVKIEIKEIFIDDIDQFKNVIEVKPTGKEVSGISEEKFKNGIQKIIGEKCEFKDWGGEKSDLMTTQIRISGKRLASAFAFKGPGQKGKLTPAKMGNNGDQALRLFEEEADLYVVHHWREIDSSVRVLINALAISRSVMKQKKIFFCIVDGQDSSRLVAAYPEAFK